MRSNGSKSLAVIWMASPLRLHITNVRMQTATTRAFRRGPWRLGLVGSVEGLGKLNEGELFIMLLAYTPSEDERAHSFHQAGMKAS
jgi:hypothetical protein